MELQQLLWTSAAKTMSPKHNDRKCSSIFPTHRKIECLLLDVEQIAIMSGKITGYLDCGMHVCGRELSSRYLS